MIPSANIYALRHFLQLLNLRFRAPEKYKNVTIKTYDKKRSAKNRLMPNLCSYFKMMIFLEKSGHVWFPIAESSDKKLKLT